MGFQPWEPDLPRRKALEGLQRTRIIPSDCALQNRDDVPSLMAVLKRMAVTSFLDVLRPIDLAPPSSGRGAVLAGSRGGFQP
jgi:hypothetical protein